MHPLGMYCMGNKTVSRCQVILVCLTAYIAGQCNLIATAQKEKSVFHKYVNEFLETTAIYLKRTINQWKTCMWWVHQNFVLCLFVNTFYLKYSILQELVITEETKKVAATKGPVKWLLQCPDYLCFVFHFSVQPRKFDCFWCLFLDSCSYTMELMSVNASSPAATIYFGTWISLTV